MNTRYFTLAIYTTIMLNSVQMGVQVDHSGPGWDEFFFVLETICTVIFVFEMFLKLGAYKCDYFRISGWNTVDFVIVITSVLDQWLIQAFLGSEDSSGWFLSVLRTLRI